MEQDGAPCYLELLYLVAFLLSPQPAVVSGTSSRLCSVKWTYSGSEVGQLCSSHALIPPAPSPICLPNEQYPRVMQAQDTAVPCPFSLTFQATINRLEQEPDFRACLIHSCTGSG